MIFPTRRITVNPRPARWPALAFACLLLAACQDRHQPVKPTVQQPVPAAAV